MPIRLALKVDVDTDRGTREGVPNLVADCRVVGAPAAFLFSLGPDQTGRAITRVFRPGFFKKVSRTSVVQIYGVRTLLNGTLLPAPHIGRRNTAVMRSGRGADGGCAGLAEQRAQPRSLRRGKPALRERHARWRAVFSTHRPEGF